MKKTKIIIPALGMLLLSTAASISGTVAWFSMNNKVTVTGMSVTTKVSSSILISETNADAASYGDELNQVRSGKLEPASTVNAINYFYTTNAVTCGDAKENVYKAYSEAELTGDNPATEATENDWDNELENTNAGKTHYDSVFNSSYGFTAADTDNVAYAYMDYVFYLRATNTSASASHLRMTECLMKYNNGAITEKAWRVAVFSQPVTAYAQNVSDITASDRKAILAFSGAANFDANQAVASTSALGSVSYATPANLLEVNSGVTAWQKVTVRLWLEGEDTTCNNETFAQLTEAYTLKLAFRIDDQENAAANITTAA